MRILADRDICVSAGQCFFVAPTIFDQAEEDGLVDLLVNEVTPGTEDAVRQAIQLCPARALSVEE
ncbi:MAG: ferredoxin [Actinophytocola sp.]|uniref:ferredoxin n=1 Tax=Actinophytocola sp. TaxID=1872138 RepID=UPI00132C1125|nr:ferredoxin [Actinophytocola sp.]MPZ78872.1 ferredoxin [Actinophytocola sp.]